MTWVPTDDGRTRCDRHDTTFGARETCASCLTDPGPPVRDVEEPDEPPPDGCFSATDHEKKLTDIAEYLEEKGRYLCEGGAKRVNYATAAKLFELAIKAYRAAGEYTQTRERRAHVKRLERKRREMTRGRAAGGSN